MKAHACLSWVVLSAIGFLLLAASSLAQTYVLGPSVIGGGGGRTSGIAYSLTGTLGQSSPVGNSAGAHYMTHHGFWRAITENCLIAMTVAIERINTTTARLFWDPVPGATTYDIYRSSSVVFAPGSLPWTSVSADTTTQFADGVGDPSVNYFFMGKVRNASEVSSESNIVGEFDFGAGSLLGSSPMNRLRGRRDGS